jgi:hypothetical protein
MLIVWLIRDAKARFAPIITKAHNLIVYWVSRLFSLLRMGLWSISCGRLCIGQPWLWRITGNWGSVPERTHEKRRSQLRLAAGAKTFRIGNAWKGDYPYQQLLNVVDWNEWLIDLVMSSKFRASLVPAAAVIPAELEMGNIVAVKTYVVTFVNFATLYDVVLMTILTIFLVWTPRVN